MKIEGHDSVAPSVKPKGNGGLLVPKLHEPVIADTSTKSCDSLALSITPNGHDGPASSNKTPKRHESAIVNTMPESSRSLRPMMLLNQVRCLKTLSLEYETD